jgi:hypothetical protein
MKGLKKREKKKKRKKMRRPGLELAISWLKSKFDGH